MMTDREILELICAAEREAAALILHARSVLAECKSGRRDVVTDYDRRVQALLIERLSAAVPGARFFCEENDRHDDLRAEAVFVIDPIDGTMNFVRGFHHSCISIAFLRPASPTAAAPSSTAGRSMCRRRLSPRAWSAWAPRPTRRS